MTAWPWKSPVALSFGGGVNSTALLIGLWERYARLPEFVLFADTGGEAPETYEAVSRVAEWLSERGASLTVVSNADPGGERHGHTSLEDECLRNATLPSLAFGFKGCSAKWKRQPMDRWLKAEPRVIAAHESGQPVIRLLGIDADEAHRSAALEDETFPWVYRRPLIEWGWGREECVAAIERADLAVPPKSACWFCPAAKKHEVLALAEERPDLFDRAVAMERNAEPSLGSVRGLGRNWSWEELVRADRAQLRLFPETVQTTCGCYDGSGE